MIFNLSNLSCYSSLSMERLDFNFCFTHFNVFFIVKKKKKLLYALLWIKMYKVNISWTILTRRYIALLHSVRHTVTIMAIQKLLATEKLVPNDIKSKKEKKCTLNNDREDENRVKDRRLFE